jgi:signal peptidase II
MHSIKLWITVFVTLCLDQATKFKIFELYELHFSEVLIEKYLWITPKFNKGAAFSFLADVENSNIFFVIISVAFIPLLLWMCYTKYVKAPSWAFGMLVGGAIGNSIDRLLPDQAVRDFIDLKWWPVFNVADAGIAIGCFTLIVWSLFFAKDEHHSEGPAG